MTYLDYIVLFFTAAPFGVGALLFSMFAVDSLIKGHDLPTSSRVTKALAAIIKQYKPGAKIFYDLGCARGTLSLRMKSSFPALKVRGVDSSAVRIFFAVLKSKILWRKVDFKKQDIFETDLSDADAVYAYIWYDHMPRLENKLQAELKQGAVIITNTVHFPNWQPIKKVVTCSKVYKMLNFETLFVYVKR